MEHFPDNSKLQQYGSIILSKLSSFECYPLGFFEHGGIKALISAMTTHSLDASIQEAACFTLLNLCSHINLKEAMSNDGAIDSIAMVMHTTNLLTQELGCTKWWNSGYHKYRAASHRVCRCARNGLWLFVKFGFGIDVIVLAMVLHPEERLVQEKAVNC
jgi:hypothetical protein